jgi:hypothetical protein
MKNMKVLATLIAGVASFGLSATPAFAWGNDGHVIIGHIAYGLLTPAARAKVDAMLAADKDTLTPPDFASRTSWAEVYRNMGEKKVHYEQTHLWFFADVELSSPILDEACHQFPALAVGTFASAGPPDACLTLKLIQFEDELSARNTPVDERLRALKYVMNFVGDIHQPFHTSDNHDDHGNCLQVRSAPGAEQQQLHHFWDDTAVDRLVATDRAQHPDDTDLAKFGQRLRSEIKPAEETKWASGDAKQWTLETFQVAKTVGYDLPPHPVCTPGMKWADYPPFLIGADYQARTVATVRKQLEEAGVRLAWVLNNALK